MHPSDSAPESPPGSTDRPSTGFQPPTPEPPPTGDTPQAPPSPGLYDVPVTPVMVAGRGPRRLPVVGIALAIVVVLGGGGLFMAGYTFGQRQAQTPGTPVSQEEAFRPFWDAYHAVVQRYAGGEVDHKALIEGAIRGMIESLDDPYSSYLTPEEYRESLQGISGQFEGIGAEIGTESTDASTTDCATLGPDCRLVVIAPIEGSPAEKAGIQPGDFIVGVDGSTLDGLTSDEARDRIRGEKGTEVTLSVVRGEGKPFDVTIVRDVIIQKEVIQRDLAGGTVGYIELTGFSENAADRLAEEVATDVEAGRKKLILDLRGNPGGFVTAALKVASQYIGEGTIYWEERADGTQEATNATPDGAAIDPSLEVVVLIDAGSASASEIVAGALQDAGRATIVGQPSFGKGTIQSWEELAGGNGAMRLTIAKWLTPAKRWIHGVGITPDVAVTVPADQPADSDPVLDRALEILDESAAALPRAA
jgi:carboxyl-terminal processing protease